MKPVGPNANEPLGKASALRIGVIGLGTIARFYLEAIERVDGLKLTAVCDTREEQLKKFRGVVDCDRDYRALLQRDLDAVIVCAPNDLHAPIGLAAVAAGKHVCIEKPLALNVKEGRALLEAARAHERIVFTAFHRRYNRHVLELAERMVGRTPARVALRYLEEIREHIGVDPWYLDKTRCGGGCVADNGPNAFDTLRLLLGELRVVRSEVFFDPDGIDKQAAIHLVNDAGVDVHVELDWAYPDGQAKDVTVWLRDGTTLRADMLEGYGELKGSLPHEYEAILRDFQRLVNTRVAPTPPDHDAGLTNLRLVEDAYRLSSRNVAPGAIKRPVEGRIVKLLSERRIDRGMTLIEHRSRCVTKGEIHELVTTDQPNLEPHARVDRVGFLGFAEIADAGVLDRGDIFEVNGRAIGTVVGFDACHFPNHYNVLIYRESLETGASLALQPGQSVRFVPRETSSEEPQRYL